MEINCVVVSVFVWSFNWLYFCCSNMSVLWKFCSWRPTFNRIFHWITSSKPVFFCGEEFCSAGVNRNKGVIWHFGGVYFVLFLRSVLVLMVTQLHSSFLWKVSEVVAVPLYLTFGWPFVLFCSIMFIMGLFVWFAFRFFMFLAEFFRKGKSFNH